MKSVRLFVWIAAGMLVFGGFFASQASFWNNVAPAWAHRVDTPQIAGLSTVLLLASLAGFLDKGENS